MNNFIVSIDIYDQDVMFHVGDFDSLCDTLTESGVDIDELRSLFSNCPKAATIAIDGGGIVVYIPQNKPLAIVTELVHELWHVVNRIAERIGISYSHESEECYAYLYTYLFKNALNKLGLNVSSDIPSK